MQHRLVIRRRRETTTLVLVSHTDLDGLKSIQDVEFGDRDVVEGVQASRLAHHHGIEPPHATATAGVGTKFVTAIHQRFPEFVSELSREGTRPHAGDVGLGDTRNPAEVVGAES